MKSNKTCRRASTASKLSDDTLASMKQMRDAREKNLDAARQKLSAMINARRKLDVDVAKSRSQAQAGRSRASLERLRLRRQPTGPCQGSHQRHPHAARRSRQARERRRQRPNGNPVERFRPGRHHRPGDPILQPRREGCERNQSVRREEAGSSRREFLSRRHEVATHQLRPADLGNRRTRLRSRNLCS